MSNQSEHKAALARAFGDYWVDSEFFLKKPDGSMMRLDPTEVTILYDKPNEPREPVGYLVHDQYYNPDQVQGRFYR